MTKGMLKSIEGLELLKAGCWGKRSPIPYVSREEVNAAFKENAPQLAMFMTSHATTEVVTRRSHE